MAEKSDYYEVLGLDRNASEADIKRAYRKLAREHHPDVSKEQGAEERFKEIGEAYAVLSDAQKRRQYDMYGHAGPGLGGMDWGDFNPFDIFNMVFGVHPRQRWARTGPQRERGDDLRKEISISLEDVYRGAETEVTVERSVRCEACAGTGAERGASPVTCQTCGGYGQVRTSRQTFFMQFEHISTCPTCNGRGSHIQDLCGECKGHGAVRDQATLTVRIPRGIEDGQSIRYQGEGDVGRNGGLSGDLYVQVFVKPHEVFERRGDALICQQKITFAQAALGDTVQVPTLDVPAALTIPAGTQTGQSFCLRGKGLPSLRGHVEGDLYVIVTIVTPTKLSKRQKELLLELARESGEEIKPADESLLNRVKQALRR